ncbi:YeiH family protein [Neobacillus dielmonensis]|uniref:YeiH family protein n=1 Tax=Neobacillus dielmonensis TaxID=1347369 RepID=UPI0005A759E3|nr:putative sulfate exporter family transporter [Neobacillus dielmonensis]
MESNTSKDLPLSEGGKQLSGTPKSTAAARSWLGGVMFTLVLAAGGFVLSAVPGFNRVGPMACSIILAILYRHFWRYPQAIQSGIQFSAKHFLRFAIVLYGLKLDIHLILASGPVLILRDAGVIIFSLMATVWLGRKVKADRMISLLLGVGTGVCGAAAIAAVAPIVKAKEEDTAISVGIIALVGTIFSIVYTVIRPVLPLSVTEYGIWSGSSLHEIAHAALAGAVAGMDGLTMALLAKLGRVLLLVPLCFGFMYWMKRKNKNHTVDTKVEFPWFLVGFMIMSLFGSFALGRWIPVSPMMMDGLSQATTYILSSAMVGLGLNVNLRHLRTKALRPLVAMLVTSILLSILTFLLV